jgi:hypothetical protein
MPVDEISRRLGAMPEHGWTAGDPRTTPRGRALPGLRKESYWAKGVKPPADQEPDEVIADHVAVMRPRQRFFASVVRAGGRVEYYLSCQSSGAVGVVFEPSLLSELGRMHIRLGIDGFASYDSK